MPISTSLDVSGPVIRLTGDIEMPLAYALVDEFSLLHDYYQFRDVQLHIDSPGGSADALHFLVHALEPWSRGDERILRTFGMNEVASAAAMLLSFGTVGYRAASKRSRLLYHSVRNVQRENTSHTVAQLKVVTRKLESWDRMFVDLLAEHSLSGRNGEDGTQFRARLKRLMRKERFIAPEVAQEMKLLDKVI
jgi:ATP-dependent protease ClpP protease subunit